jgi:uncharacterized protein
MTEHDMPIEVSLPGDSLRPEGASEFSLGTVSVAGAVSRIDTEYLFQGVISGGYRQPCDRCLEQTEAPFRLEIQWLFEASGPEQNAPDEREAEIDLEVDDDDRIRFYECDELDLAAAVWEEIILTAPAKFLCTEDCKGLCSSCGANLNRGPCGCKHQSEIGSSGLSALADLFPDLSESEE